MKPATHSFYTDAVQRVIEHVVSHLGEALELETLAEQACLSPFHFHRVFRGMVGETPLELVRRLRLERAAWRLLHTDAPVTAIAFDAGCGPVDCGASARGNATLSEAIQRTEATRIPRVIV